jgi:hypothetical protein
VYVWLPRSFRGFITSSTLSGGTSFSEAISNGGYLIENGFTTKMFVGDFSSNADDLEFEEGDAGASQWKGDMVALKTLHGRVQVRYIDEDILTPPASLRGGGFRAGGRGLRMAGVGPGWLPPILHPLFPLTASAHLINAMPGMPGGPSIFQRPERSRTSGFWGLWR